MTDETGETIGTVEDVLLALDTGRAERFVIEIDSGFLDLFGDTTEIPVDAVSIDPLAGKVVIPRAAVESAGDE